MNAHTPRTGHGNLVEPATLRIERLLPGSAERLWAYITDGEKRARWLAGGAMDLVKGATFTLNWRNDEISDVPSVRPDTFGEEHRMESRITEIDPPRRLSFTWSGTGEVTFELDERSDGVLLSITHRRVTDRNMLLSVSAGWHAHLDVLAAVLGGVPRPAFWENWKAIKADYAARFPA